MDQFDFPEEGVRAANSRGGMSRLVPDLLARWHWIAAAAVCGTLVGAYVLSKTPEKYRATTTLLIKQRTKSLLAKEQTEELDIASSEAFNTIATRIRRPELLEFVASRQDVRSLPGLVPPSVEWRPNWFLKMTGRPVPDQNASRAGEPVPSAAALAGMMADWLDVAIVPRTRLLNITVTHTDPEVSRALADAIAREYLGEIHRARTTGRDSAIDILLKESEDTQKKLEASQNALAVYGRAVQLQKELEEIEKEVQALERRYRSRHPRLIEAKSRFASAGDRFLDAFDHARTAPSDSTYWSTVEEILKQAADDPEDHLKTARNLLLSRSSVLSNEIESRTGIYNAMLTQIQQASVNQQGGESEAEISSFARLPGRPSSPDPKRLLGMGGGGGLALGLGFAFLLVRLDNKYHTVAQLEEDSGMPVLAAVSRISPRQLRSAEDRFAVIVDDPLDEIRDNWDETLVFRPGASSTSYAEMFRVLRASVLLLGDESQRKVTLVTSALPGEGKSTVAANFALASAGQGRSTILVDLDLRKPTLHRLFGSPRHGQGRGLTEHLAGQASLEEIIVTSTGEPSLHMIPSGKRSPNPGELLTGARIKALLEVLCRVYDVVVLDTAPILAVPDTRLIAPYAHNRLVVVRAEHTPKGATRRCLELLEEGGTPPAGLVLNGFREKRTRMGDNYSYGYYRDNRYGYGAYGVYGEDDEDDRPLKKRVKNRKRKKSVA